MSNSIIRTKQSAAGHVDGKLHSPAQVVPDGRDLIPVTILFQNITHKRPWKQFTVFEICTNFPSNTDYSDGRDGLAGGKGVSWLWALGGK